MESLSVFITGVLRYFFPAMAFIILSRCIVSLFRNRPRVHKMAQLRDVQSGNVYDIDHWETSIGRSKSNDITLTQPTVSRFHAVVSKKKHDWVITDTFSKSGVYLNGKKIKNRAEIEDGDILLIGGVSFKFNCAEAISYKSREEMKKNVKKQNVMAYGVLVDVATHKPVYIKKKDVLIGRSEYADIKIISDKVSAEHARIYQTSKGFAVCDLDSHNGTKLNGRFISQPRLIFDNDMLTFGDRVFVYYEK